MKPSDHLKAGQCPFCHGTGKVHFILDDKPSVCPLCLGTKAWPPPTVMIDGDEVPL